MSRREKADAIRLFELVLAMTDFSWHLLLVIIYASVNSFKKKKKLKTVCLNVLASQKLIISGTAAVCCSLEPCPCLVLAQLSERSV